MDTRIPHATLLARHVAAQPYPLLFSSISGAHLYGFSSADSDVDLRGMHLLPPGAFLGLDPPADETIARTEIDEGVCSRESTSCAPASCSPTCRR
jgi:hypothetical protein